MKLASLPDALMDLLDVFSEEGGLFKDVVQVAGPEIPEPYRQLLVHNHHMTVTLENHHQCRVALHVVAQSCEDERYTRKILLSSDKTGQIIMFGIMRFDLRFAAPEVRKEIVAGQTPLGRILIEHRVMRRVEAFRFFRIQPGTELAHYFRTTQPAILYGRLAKIYCGGQPAVDVFEIVRPEKSSR